MEMVLATPRSNSSSAFVSAALNRTGQPTVEHDSHHQVPGMELGSEDVSATVASSGWTVAKVRKATKTQLFAAVAQLRPAPEALAACGLPPGALGGQAAGGGPRERVTLGRLRTGCIPLLVPGFVEPRPRPPSPVTGTDATAQPELSQPEAGLSSAKLRAMSAAGGGQRVQVQWAGGQVICGQLRKAQGRRTGKVLSSDGEVTFFQMSDVDSGEVVVQDV